MIPLLLLAAVLATQDTTALTVTVAIDRALTTHPAVAAARADRDVAAAGVGQARADWLPSLAFDGTVNRFQDPMLVYPLHSLDLRAPPVFDRNLSQAQVGAAYTVFDFGARSSRVKSAVAQREAATASLSSAEQQLVARTAAAFLDVLTAREVLAAADQRIAALEAEAARARSFLSAGKAARLDTLRAAAELAAARADRVAGAGDEEIAERNLARLIEVPFETVHGARLATVQLSPAVNEADASSPRSAYVERADGANADVRVAAMRADAARAAVGSARSTLLPQLQATGAVVDRSNVTGAYQAEWQVGVELSYPLFTGGARPSAISAAEAAARAAQAQLRLARLSTAQQVDEADATLDEARARVAALAVAVAQSAEVARVMGLSRDAGEGTQTDFLTAEASLFHARSNLAQARHAVIAARVELARVLGELSRQWIASSLETQP